VMLAALVVGEDGGDSGILGHRHSKRLVRL
jgi:hypothetical protein